MRHLKLFESWSKKENQFPIRELNYPLGYIVGGDVVETKKISDLLKNDDKGYLKGLEEVALRLALAGVQPLYNGRQSTEAIKNVLGYSDYYGSLRDFEGSDLKGIGSLKISRFFEQFNPEIEGKTFGFGLAFSRDKSLYTPEQIAESNAVQEMLSPDSWSTKPEMGYVAAIQWAQMRIAGEIEKSLGEYLLNTRITHL